MRKEKCFCASFIHTWAQRLFYHISSSAGFFSLSLVDILDQVIFHCERPPVFCRLFSSISVLYPLDAGSTPCPSKLWQLKMSPEVVNYFSNGWHFHCSVFAHISVAFFIAFLQSEVATYFLRLGPPRLGAFLMAEMVKKSACNAADLGLIPGLGRSPGEGNGIRLQYSCLENSMDRGAWQATVHGVAKSQTRLND